MTKEELATIVEFFKTITQHLDGIINDIHFFTGKLIGKAMKEEGGETEKSKSVPNPILLEGEGIMKYQNKTIIKRSDGRWFARYRMNGQVKCVYDKTQQGCYDKLKKALANIKSNGGTSSRKTYNDWIRIWLEVYKKPNNAPATMKKQLTNWHKWIEPTIGKKVLSSIKTIDLQSFLASVPYKRQSQHLYTFIKDSLTKAYINGEIKSNPTLLLKKPKYDEDERRHLSVSEEKAFVEKAKQTKYWSMYALMLYEGLRPGEVLGLKYGDIKDTYIVVSRAKDELNNIKGTKTGKSRKIPIFESFKTVADELRKGESGEYIFDGKKGLGAFNFREIVEDLGINDIVPYSLRHNFGTRCAEKGITAKQTQLWMGHSSVDVTLKYYTNINDEFEQMNIEKINTDIDKFYK